MTNDNTSNYDAQKYINNTTKELLKVNNLLYQYRPCRRDESIIYDIENIRHNVVYAQTPLNMNDPFDSKIGLSSDKLFDELINMVIELTTYDNVTKQIIFHLLKHILFNKLEEFLLVLSEMKKIIYFQRKEMHKEHLEIGNFVLQCFALLYNKLPRTIKAYMDKNSFKIFGIFVSTIDNMEITEKDINKVLGFDKQLNDMQNLIIELQNSKYIPELDKFLSKLTISCSSASGWNNSLMWAHYACSYRGFCVEYDFSEFSKVEGIIKKV